jgi:hypothetical protein
MPVTRVAADAEKFLRRIAGTVAAPIGLTRVDIDSEIA